MSFVLLRQHEPRDPVALGGRGERSAADLARDADTIAQHLPDPTDHSEVLVACADRYAFAACVLGAWARGHAVALAPLSEQGRAGSMAALPQVRAMLHDTDAANGIAVLPLLSNMAAPAVSAHSAPIEGSRHLVTLFTSGSTGAPRSIRKSADQLLGEAQLLGEGLCAGLRRFACSVQPIHIYGFLFGVGVPLLHAGAFVRTTPLHAEAVAATVREFAADALVSVPAHLRALEVLEPHQLDPAVRIFSSGAELPQPVAEMLASRFGLTVHEVLGSSETGGIAWRSRATDPWSPLPWARVTSAEDGQMILDSPLLAADKGRPLPCPDRIALNPDGTFRHLGRRDNVVKVASKRVDLDEMQRALATLPGVLDAAVVAEATSDARGTRVVAVVVAPTWSSGALRDALRAQFDPVVLPRQIVCVESLPRESNGKLTRERLLSVANGPRERAALRHFDPRPRTEAGTFDVHVSPQLAYFEGHFQSEPILAGIVQLHVLVSRQIVATWPELVRLRRVTKLRFSRPIRPSDELVLQLSRAEPARVDFKIHCGSHACSSGSLHFET